MRTIATAVALVASAVGSHAAPSYFFGNAPSAGGVFPTDDPTSAPRVQQAAFTSLVNSGRLTETFENAEPGSLALNNNQLPIFGNTGAVLQNPIDNPDDYVGGVVKSGIQSNGRFNTTGGEASGRWIESDWGFSLNLGSAVAAFGFYGTDFGDFDGGLEIELYNGDERVLVNAFTDENGVPLVPRSAAAARNNMVGVDGSLLFFGFASDTFRFDRIVFKISQSTAPGADFDTLGFDDIIIGNMTTTGGPIPEPTSLALVGLALAGLGASRARRRA